ncbi:MAG: multidrug effflux MFS transporter [Gammaproteobacteria bacterium]
MKIKIKFKKTSIMVLLFFVPFLMGMGVDLYVPSLPAIAIFYQTDPHWVQLTIGLYMLGYGVGQLFLGVLSDSLGRKKIMLMSGISYVIISYVASVSPEVWFLNLARFIQGFGIAGLGVAVRAVASDCFNDLDLTKALTCFSMSWALGPIIGPFLGSYLQHFFGWKANFYFFAIYGAIITFYIVLFIPETIETRHPLHLKILYNSAKVICKNKTFIAASLIASLVYSVLVLFNVVGPFLIQKVLHYTVIDYGRFALILGVAYFLGNFSNRILVNYCSPVRIVYITLLLSLVISIAMLLLALIVGSCIVVVLAPVFSIFYLSAMMLPNMVSKSVGMFPKQGGTANAICGTVVALGVFIMSSFASSLKIHSQMPLAIMYMVILFASLMIFSVYIKKNDSVKTQCARLNL